jgi:hypothetical protein
LQASNASPVGVFSHVLGEENFGWLVTFTGRQARLADDELAITNSPK